MTNKEIIERITKVDFFKEKYNISQDDVDLVLKTAGTKGKSVLKLLYVLVKQSTDESLNKSTIEKQTYKILKTKFNIS